MPHFDPRTANNLASATGIRRRWTFFSRFIHPTGDWDPWKFRISGGFLFRIPMDFQDMFRRLGSMKVQQKLHSWCWLDGDLWMSTENLCRGYEISIENLSFLPWSEFDQIPLVIEGQPWGIKGIRESMAQELRWEKLKIHEGLSQVHSSFFKHVFKT